MFNTKQYLLNFKNIIIIIIFKIDINISIYHMRYNTDNNAPLD